MSAQQAGIIGFIAIVAALGALVWALISGSWFVFRWVGAACGLASAVIVIALTIALLLDTLGRYRTPAIVSSAEQGAAYGEVENRSVDGRVPEVPHTVKVQFSYEAKGKTRIGRRYAPVDIYLQDKDLDRTLRQLRSGPNFAYVSVLNPDNAVLARALGARALSLVLAAFGAVVLLYLFWPWGPGHN